MGSEIGGDRTDSVEEGKMGGLLAEDAEQPGLTPTRPIGLVGLVTMAAAAALAVLRVNLLLHLSRSGSDMSWNGICCAMMICANFGEICVWKLIDWLSMVISGQNGTI